MPFTVFAIISLVRIKASYAPCLPEKALEVGAGGGGEKTENV